MMIKRSMLLALLMVQYGSYSFAGVTHSKFTMLDEDTPKRTGHPIKVFPAPIPAVEMAMEVTSETPVTPLPPLRWTQEDFLAQFVTSEFDEAFLEEYFRRGFSFKALLTHGRFLRGVCVHIIDDSLKFSTPIITGYGFFKFMYEKIDGERRMDIFSDLNRKEDTLLLLRLNLSQHDMHLYHLGYSAKREVWWPLSEKFDELQDAITRSLAKIKKLRAG